jgi:hypothetical protein
MATKKAVESPAEVSTEGTTDVPSTDPTELKDSTPSTGKSVDDLAAEVLSGAWGDSLACRGRLDNAGYDPEAVILVVNERLSKGAPSAYRPSPIGLLKQVQDGLWGDQKTVLGRLAGAGFSAHVVAEVLRNLEKS